MAVGPFLDLAISLHSPRRFFVVSDATLTSNTHRGGIEACAREQRGMEFVYLDGRELSFDQVLAKLRTETTARASC